MNVRLSQAERDVAMFLAKNRIDQAVSEGRKDTLGADSLTSHQLGVLGEMAYAKYKNRYFDFSCGTFKTRPDVGGVEVRTRSRDNASLIIRRNDSDERAFVLVTRITEEVFRIVGGIRGRDAKQDKWWKDIPPLPAWFVPQEALIPINR